MADRTCQEGRADEQAEALTTAKKDYRAKWDAFYDGSYTPHLGDGARGTQEQLPWRSFAPASQLRTFVEAGRLPTGCRALELGCGHGESLVYLAQHCAFACGVDIVAKSVEACNAAITDAGLSSRAEAVNQCVMELPEGGPLLRHGGSWEFDFVFDCQCFHCLRLVPGIPHEKIAQVYYQLLRPGGRLLLLTGSTNEPTHRGPEPLSREEVLEAFRGWLVCEEIAATHFDWTPTYKRQGLPDPPLGWISVWTRPLGGAAAGA